MIFTETNLKGAFIIEPEKLEDDRGFFARSWCQREFEAHALNPRLSQCSISFSKQKRYPARNALPSFSPGRGEVGAVYERFYL